MDLLTELGVTDEQIAGFCRRWQITEFAIFGSAVRHELRPDSDIDVLVTFADGVSNSIGNYMAMEEELAAMFGRPIDLVSRRVVENSPNYLRRRSVLESAQLVYATT